MHNRPYVISLYKKMYLSFASDLKERMVLGELSRHPSPGPVSTEPWFTMGCGDCHTTWVDERPKSKDMRSAFLAAISNWTIIRDIQGPRATRLSHQYTANDEVRCIRALKLYDRHIQKYAINIAGYDV